MANKTTETGNCYGQEAPVWEYDNHCNGCGRDWTVRIAMFSEATDQVLDNCTVCYTGPFATYNED